MSTVDGGTDRALTEAEPPTAPIGEPDGREIQGGRFQRLRRRTLTVSVEGALLRVVGFSGGRVVAWATIDLDDGQPNLITDMDADLPQNLAGVLAD